MPGTAAGRGRESLTRDLPQIVPVLGCVVLISVALIDPDGYRFLVREDSLLEWAEVIAFGLAAIVALRVAMNAQGLTRFAYATVVVAGMLAVGEELSWGQRVFDIDTPDGLAAANRQQELNAHNIAGAERIEYLTLIVAGLYGSIAPFVRRPGPLVPPRAAAFAFAIVAAYFAVRLVFLPRPTYAQAKFSEWPELCFAAGIVLTARAALRAV